MRTERKKKNNKIRNQNLEEIQVGREKNKKQNKGESRWDGRRNEKGRIRNQNLEEIQEGRKRKEERGDVFLKGGRFSKEKKRKKIEKKRRGERAVEKRVSRA